VQELILVGRGGEGVVVASQVLADALARAGFHVQAFPEFKAERRGAPISAFLRWDERPIHRRYRIGACDVLATVSPVPPSPELLRMVRPGGVVVLNREARLPLAGPFTLARAPASRIARDLRVLSPEGRPMANTAVLGACLRLILPDGLDLLEQAIRTRLPAGAADANVRAAREGYAHCLRQRPRPGDMPLPAAIAAPAIAPTTPAFAVSTTDSLGVRTGAWALDRPVPDDACTGCALCALFCPEAAIHVVDGHAVVDESHCKGCGICVEVCPVRNAIHLEEVRA
jgi:2-oxoacid:acceptor oxidoreductase gamma subunit (pyruvate/2-ketoisovalerate family)/2-oxoacid:acceptor oxidoreductase delta subunit (pyruvate/2-ketoisovalerate family)